MSTPNFYIINTSKIFAIGMNKCSDDGSFDEFATNDDYELQKECLVNNLKTLHWEESSGAGDTPRSYPSSCFAEKMVCIQYGKMDIEIIVKAIQISGYYDGANLDWEAKTYVWYDGYSAGEYDMTGNYAVSENDVINDNWMNNSGFSKIHAENIIKRINNELNKLSDELENVYEQICSDKFVFDCVFKNGEAIYHRVG